MNGPFFAYGFINAGIDKKIVDLNLELIQVTWEDLKRWHTRKGYGFTVPSPYLIDAKDIFNTIFFVDTRENEKSPRWASDDVLNTNELVKILDEEIEYRLQVSNSKEAPTLKGVKSVTKMSYYNQGSIECIEAIKAALTKEEFIGWLRGTIIKYQWRLGGKNSAIEDSNKTLYYLNRLVAELQEMGVE